MTKDAFKSDCMPEITAAEVLKRQSDSLKPLVEFLDEVIATAINPALDRIIENAKVRDDI